MANDELTPFLQLGPFLGMDNANAQPYMAEGMAVYSRNCNTYKYKNGLTAERGRKLLKDFSAYFNSINVLTYVEGYLSPGSQPTPSTPYLLIQGVQLGGGSLLTILYDILNDLVITTSGAIKYTQAVQYGAVVYTNGGQRFFLNTVDFVAPLKFYQWQYAGFATSMTVITGVAYVAFSGFPTTGQTWSLTVNAFTMNYAENTGLTLPASVAAIIIQINATGGMNALVRAEADPNNANGLVLVPLTTTALTISKTDSASMTSVLTQGGQIGPNEQCFYVTTQLTELPDGTFSETSPENYPSPVQISNNGGVTGPGSANLNVVSPNLGPGGHFTGTNADGTTFTTNIYRQTSDQAGYFLIGNASTDTPFFDKMSDQTAAQQTPLLVVDNSAFQRDPPPCGGLAAGMAVNYAYLCVYNSCMFVLAHIDNTIVVGSSPSTQLWYSQAGKPWEFSSDTRALLLQDTIENNLPLTTSPLNPSSPQYNQLTGDYAKGLVVCGTTLVAIKHREFWLVYGNGSSQSPFTQISAFNIGGTAIRGITPAIGGAFIKTENGLYFFDGSSPQYDEGSFRTVNANQPFNHTLADDSACVGAFSNLSYVLCYTTLGKSYTYNTVIGQWMTELDYAPCSPDAMCYVPADPSYMSNTQSGANGNVGFVCAARFGQPALVDFWFADDTNDLGSPTIFVWQGAETDAPGDEFRKEYKKINVFAPIQPGILSLKLIVDESREFDFTFNLSGQRPLIANLTAEAQGYSAQLIATVQGVAGQPAPQIWKIRVWGTAPPMRKLEVRQ